MKKLIYILTQNNTRSSLFFYVVVGAFTFGGFYENDITFFIIAGLLSLFFWGANLLTYKK